MYFFLWRWGKNRSLNTSYRGHVVTPWSWCWWSFLPLRFVIRSNCPFWSSYFWIYCFIESRSGYCLLRRTHAFWSRKSRPTWCAGTTVWLRFVLSRSRRGHNLTNLAHRWPFRSLWRYRYLGPSWRLLFWIIRTWSRNYYFNLLRLCFCDCPTWAFGCLFLSIHVISRSRRKRMFITKCTRRL